MSNKQKSVHLSHGPINNQRRKKGGVKANLNYLGKAQRCRGSRWIGVAKSQFGDRCVIGTSGTLAFFICFAINGGINLWRWLCSIADLVHWGGFWVGRSVCLLVFVLWSLKTKQKVTFWVGTWLELRRYTLLRKICESWVHSDVLVPIKFWK